MPTLNQPYPVWAVVTVDDEILTYTVRSYTVRGGTKEEISSVRYWDPTLKRFRYSHITEGDRWFSTFAEALDFRMQRAAKKVEDARAELERCKNHFDRIAVDTFARYQQGAP